MEKTIEYLPPATAAAFACGVAYMLGWCLGVGQPEIFWFLTFADFANASIPALAIFGFLLIINFASEGRRLLDVAKNPQPVSTRAALITLFYALFILGFLISLYWFDEMPGFVFIIIVVGICALLLASTYIEFVIGENWSRTARVWSERTIVAVVFMFIFGVMGGELSKSSSEQYLVTTNGSQLAGHAGLSIERGIVVSRPSGFDLIPWDKVAKFQFENGNAPVTSPNKPTPPKPHPTR